MFPRKQIAMIPAAFATAILALLVAIGHVPAPEYASTSVVKDGIAFADTPVDPLYYASTQVPTFGDTMIIEDPEGVAVVDPATGDIDYTSPTLLGTIRGFPLQTTGVLRNDQMLPFTTSAGRTGVLFISSFAVVPPSAGVITGGTTAGAGTYVPTAGYIGTATIMVNGTLDGQAVSGSLVVTVNAALPPLAPLTITPGDPIPKPPGVASFDIPRGEQLQLTGNRTTSTGDTIRDWTWDTNPPQQELGVSFRAGLAAHEVVFAPGEYVGLVTILGAATWGNLNSGEGPLKTQTQPLLVNCQ